MPLNHEIALYCLEGAIDTSGVRAPVFVYRAWRTRFWATRETGAWSRAFPAASVHVARISRGGT